jgi:hypothetical protein
MKVLDNNNYIEVGCPHCKSKLGVHVGDIRYNEMGHHGSVFKITCEACGRPVDLNQSQIPASWISTIVPDESGH